MKEITLLLLLLLVVLLLLVLSCKIMWLVNLIFNLINLLLFWN